MFNAQFSLCKSLKIEHFHFKQKKRSDYSERFFLIYLVNLSLRFQLPDQHLLYDHPHG
jgi:hypothetical protein